MIDASTRLRRLGWLIALAVIVSQGAAPGSMLRASGPAAALARVLGGLVVICHVADDGSGAPAHHDCQHCPDCAAAHLQPASLPAPIALPSPRVRIAQAEWTPASPRAPPARIAAPQARGPPSSA